MVTKQINPDFQLRIDTFLRNAFAQAVSCPDFESPLRVLFNYCALLISSVNHPEVSQGGFVFLDLSIRSGNQNTRHLSTLSHCDHGYHGLPAGLPSVDRRIEEQAVPGLTYKPLLSQSVQDFEVAVSLGATQANAITRLLDRALSDGWKDFLASLASGRRRKTLLWPTGSAIEWPASLHENSAFVDAKRMAVDKLRELLDQLAMDLGRSTQREVRPEVFFLRKSRYYSSDGNETERQLVNRRVSDDVGVPFLMGYLLSWNQIWQLVHKFEQEKSVLNENLHQQLLKIESTSDEAESFASEWRAYHTSRLQALISDIHSAPQKDWVPALIVLSAIEQPIGDVPAVLRGDVIRAVADSMFTTTVPEIVWDVRRDPRYREEFLRKADPGVTTAEDWMWGANDTNGASLDDSKMTLVFVPYRSRSDAVFGAYMSISSRSPLGSDAAMRDLINLANRLILSQRTVFHFVLDAYPELILGVFEERLLRVLSELHSEIGRLRRKDDVVKQLVESLNESSLAIALMLDFPRISFKACGRDSDSLWRQYENELIVPAATNRFGGTTNDRDVQGQIGGEAWWEEHQMERELLEAVGLTVEYADDGLRADYVQSLLDRLLGLFIQNDLPVQIQALSQASKGGKQDYAHSLRHEIKNLLRAMRDEIGREHPDMRMLSTAESMIGYVMDAVQDDGSLELEMDTAASIDVRTCITLFERILPPFADINGYSAQMPSAIFYPSGCEDWTLPVPLGAFFQVYNNLVSNAIKALEVVTADKVPKAGADSRKVKRIHEAIERYGPYSTRQLPTDPVPTILVLVRHFGSCITLEVLDNAPSFGVRMEYPSNKETTGKGLDNISSLASQLESKLKVNAILERPHALDEADKQELAEITAFCQFGTCTAEWTLARFTIDKGG